MSKGVSLEWIDNSVFRERIKPGEYEEVADRLGWDTRRLLRTLGMKPYSRNGHKGFYKRMRYETAVKLCDAMNIDYWEVGV